MALAAASGGGVGRLGQVRRNASGSQFLGDVPPPGAPIHRERDVIAAGHPEHARYRAVDAHDGRNVSDVMNRPNKGAPTRRSTRMSA
jgi:hypothetical protein